MCVCVSDESDGRDLADLEELVWDPRKLLDDKAVDSYLIIARYTCYLLNLSLAVVWGV